MTKNIRNFCIIAHIDHGKSTLADRMLEITGTVEKRKMKEQILDRMDIERERGITIKLQPVTMNYYLSSTPYTLNLIDTPGHVDFTYEVSRSLAAVEGAILLVDATQGIQAQTLANLYLAIEQNLTIIPVANKIDLPASDLVKTKREIINLLGCQEEDIICASGKTGQGVEEILQAVIKKVPCPKAENEEALRALIFDSNYDEYKGVVAYVRIVSGQVKKGDKIHLMATDAKSEALDVGIFKPDYKPTGELKTGEIGYIVTGFKDVSDCKVGDTVALENNKNIKPLQGYKEVKPMVFAGIFPREGSDFKDLRESMEKMKLSDSSLSFEPEQSEALGFGFRCGFLGLLHLEIFQERLRREYNLDLIVTVPSVAYKIYKKNNEENVVRTPQKFSNPEIIEKIEEPWVSLDVISPKDYMGNIMELVQQKRGLYKNTQYLDKDRVILHYEVPMAAILTDFYDKIKSVSSGYASINYEFLDYRSADVVKMDILVAEETIEALATIVYRDEAQSAGKKVVKTLKDNLPKQMFVLKIQAAIGGKVIAAERLSAMRKDVTAKLYGGDVSRKRKLLEKQKKGKKKMMVAGKGSVEIPPDTFVKILKK
ncbi:elongation factor 4 [Candidatus Falkowbacteria bacterium CG11_big_fil_rev_8_21_14_0_20_39_10]|uniref:Elongation factor 4 n=1 Tax=Candidatus Falkowbacteria bacterium CG11_big_fil_rev_8_21_14_0_20_39_10 TaxID=1974570 RepID=A0A2M6K9C8_9BACT|nr:MAG: elongation factor 4 [Candidatus Falkowbacteria bacterium CG11_big_fil_rev_8_21_14_0_20_39_10]